MKRKSIEEEQDGVDRKVDDTMEEERKKYEEKKVENERKSVAEYREKG